MPQHYTDWADLGDVAYNCSDLPRTARDVEGPFVSLPQWVTNPGGGGGVVPGPNLFTLPDELLSYPQMLGAPFEVASVRGDIELRSSRNFDLLSGYQFPLSYVDQVALTVGGIRFTDPDAYYWREQTAAALINEWWETEAPVGAYSPHVEWEGFELGERFGEVHDRTVTISWADPEGWDSSATRLDVFDDGSGAGFSNPDRTDYPLLIPPVPDVKLWGAPSYLAGDEYDGERALWQPGGIGFDSTTLDAIFNEGELIGGALESTQTLPIDDVFAGISRRVDRVDLAGMVSDSATLWVIPDPLGDTRLNFDGELNLVIDLGAILTPPRYRITYTVDAVPYRRNIPTRGDGLAGGPTRNYPPLKTGQSGRRNVGGFW